MKNRKWKYYQFVELSRGSADQYPIDCDTYQEALQELSRVDYGFIQVSNHEREETRYTADDPTYAITQTKGWEV